MSRPSIHSMLMDMAYAAAQRATCSRLSVGAVVARNGRVLSTGYNGAPSRLNHCQHDTEPDKRCTDSVHAEANALIQAARHGQRIEDADLYLTHQPCRACAGLIINAGIVAVVYDHAYGDDGGLDVLSRGGIMVATYDDVLEDPWPS